MNLVLLIPRPVLFLDYVETQKSMNRLSGEKIKAEYENYNCGNIKFLCLVKNKRKHFQASSGMSEFVDFEGFFL